MWNNQTNAHLTVSMPISGVTGAGNDLATTIPPDGHSPVFYGLCRRAFTMIELIVVIAILGTLAALIIPRVSWMEPPKRILQRSFIEAVDMAKNGFSVRFRIDKDENSGIVPEILIKEEENTESTWKAFEMRWKPEGKEWAFDPELIYFFQDGTCTPAKITWGTYPYVENYLLTVTGYLVENK